MESIENATTFQELGYSSEEEVKKTLEKRGIPIRFDSVEEGIKMFPEIACRDVKFMQTAVNHDFRNICHDKTDDTGVYFIYLHRKLQVLETQSNLLKSKGESIEAGYVGLDISALKDYLSELETPKEVESGKYKVPHKFIFEELRNAEQPRRKDTGFAFNTTYNYFNVDGKLPLEYGKKLEEIYTRQDIIFGVHGTPNVDVSEYFFKGLKESTSYDRARQVNNTVLYGEYLSFTNALDYGKSFGSNTVFILGLPKNTFSKDNPVHIWGSSEKNGTKYILPEYILGYYMQGDANNRTVIENTEKSRQQYRYLHLDATVDKSDKRVIDTEELQK